ncbi:pyruvate,water dikinase [Altererythrobacter atlanticus]|uniref:Chondramide synthase cmdD n=1 Tax=Croceibacterium atlanticum TaxID=1267766 RepID=A0A0F7KYC6_9SPHN|nr:PEP-utilizing enzyme [Croceibacterium atlanticum]AKH44227.1 Chondramide synthase cmdD [Croceibacterium atlanticum]MBB5732538.1 pyruvate,water dikinase [Croceibacterium atlanticum]
MADEQKSFPLPSSVKVVPGTEDAQAAYPYYAQFTPEDDDRFWFYNSMHFPEPMHHFDMITAEAAYCALGSFNTRVHVLPTTKGIDHRVINGRVFIGGVPVTDPEEIEARTAEFQQRAFYYYENWEKLYDQWKEKMKALIADAQALPTPSLPDLEPIETTHTGKGVAANHALIDTYRKQLEGYYRMWHHHFEFLLLGYGAYLTFFDFCKRAFPEISDQAISRMVAGMEAEIFKPDEEVKRLARRAVELGVDSHFHDEMEIEQVLGALDQLGENGREWLQELETSRHPWFNVNVGDGFYHYHRSWNDDLSMPFAALPGYIDKVKKGENIERPMDQLVAEREQLVSDYRELLDSEEDKATYDQLIGLAHRVFPYVEGHKFYCEHWYTNLFFNKIREYGALLRDHGFWEAEEDVFHLTHYELESAIVDLMLAWSSGSAPLGPKRWPAIIAQRKQAIEAWAEATVPPALGAVPDVIDDPAIVMLWGITRENLDTWLSDGEENENELKGFAACSGVVEGTARVVKSVKEIGRLEEGDILVCQVTNPTWAPIFQKISAAVSDIGGSMSHMAIVAREYGLPAVVGTGAATQKIRDGQRIRVDGGRGVVTLLDEEHVLEDA